MRRLVPLLTLVATGLSTSAADFSERFATLVQSATPAQLYTLLYDLPKGGDLHHHAGGAERPEWLFAVLTDPSRNGGDTFYTRARPAGDPTSLGPGVHFRNIRQHTYARLAAHLRPEYVALAELTPAERRAWSDSLRLDQPGEGRQEFFNGLWVRRGDIGNSLPVRLEMLVANLQAFSAEGVRYLEAQFSADAALANDGTPVPLPQAVAAIRRRLAQPDAVATGVAVRFQEVVLRFRPDAEARLAELYAFVDTHRDLWVGLNLAGLEENGRGHPGRFLATLRQLRARHPTLPLSIHAGEMDGPDSHVRDTLLLGASRIGHGINLIHDADTLLLLQHSRRTLIEINLISNRLLEYVPDLAAHPFPEYLRTGVPVCLNTDDRGMWDSNLTDEYYTAVTTFHLSWDELVALGRHSLAYSFAPPDLKARLLADYDQRLAAFTAKYTAGSAAEALARLREVKPVAYGYAQRTFGLAFP